MLARWEQEKRIRKSETACGQGVLRFREMGKGFWGFVEEKGGFEILCEDEFLEIGGGKYLDKRLRFL